MRRVLAAWAVGAVLAGCEPEAELAVAEASLVDDAPVYDPAAADPRAAPMPVDPPTDGELRIRQLVRDITPENALNRARELEGVLAQEIQSLETRLTPVEVELGE